MIETRIGIVGLGNMGTAHAKYLIQNEVKGAKLTAVADPREERLQWARDEWGEQIKTFGDSKSLYRSGEVDAVIICTPHYDHPAEAMDAFDQNLHVLIEKPAGVYTRQVREMNERAAGCDKVFGIMYNQRTNPVFMKLKDLIDSGELGEIRRTNWIITDWYRTQHYYNSAGWRATWAGEGGGVLINQDPHQLDLWQWTTGLMPVRVRAFCQFGKHRDIEVENDVTAYVEYANGATGVFVTSTCEAPGTNRFEVTGDRGKVVIEGNRLTFWRLRVSETEFNRNFNGGFGSPECWEIEVPIHSGGAGHEAITKDWIRAIREGTQLIAPGEEGIKGLTLSNAMLLSTWTDNWVELPIDEDLFYNELQKRIEQSASNKQVNEHILLDLSNSRG
ncbi:oxidoreductase [Paenibacillus ferrarius]|uniref:Oxidoreductase n=1 Tax=Paenibacillus ferrarius TaxID=1469647 RepID=A0A1V4HHE5_9BACL|nr:Gfo/Idh/MocA family oxidoreductase [Paenibacillus ferrarius]OPH55986.1 oxidoreductase [Paenibacillus ferrarius]